MPLAGSGFFLYTAINQCIYSLLSCFLAVDLLHQDLSVVISANVFIILLCSIQLLQFLCSGQGSCWLLESSYSDYSDSHFFASIWILAQSLTTSFEQVLSNFQNAGNDASSREACFSGSIHPFLLFFIWFLILGPILRAKFCCRCYLS